MQVYIIHSQRLSEAFRADIKHIITSSLSDIAFFVREVRIRLEGDEVQGDKRGSLEVDLVAGGTLVVEAYSADFHTAVRRASDRARQTIKRQFESEADNLARHNRRYLN